MKPEIITFGYMHEKSGPLYFNTRQNNPVLNWRLMKRLLLLIFVFIANTVIAQDIQLHRDYRHSIDSPNNTRDFTTLSFETLKETGVGSLLMKMDLDFYGNNNNPGKIYTQLSHSLKLQIYLYWLI